MYISYSTELKAVVNDAKNYIYQTFEECIKAIKEAQLTALMDLDNILKDKGGQLDSTKQQYVSELNKWSETNALVKTQIKKPIQFKNLDVRVAKTVNLVDTCYSDTIKEYKTSKGKSKFDIALKDIKNIQFDMIGVVTPSFKLWKLDDIFTYGIETNETIMIQKQVISNETISYNQTIYSKLRVCVEMQFCSFKFKILEMKCDDDLMWPCDFLLESKDKKHHYGFIGSGYLIDPNDHKKKLKQYGRRLKTGDTLTINVNTFVGTLSFNINDKNYGTAYNIDTEIKYKIGVTLPSKNSGKIRIEFLYGCV